MPTSTDDELPPISNNDIETLYDIVLAAQAQPGPPFHALFTAYDKVLHDKGLNPDHDQVIFRLLFRMQEQRASNESLVNCFKHVLAGMGIVVDMDPEGEGIEEITRNLDDIGLDVQQTHTPSRRASFGSFFDERAEKVTNLGDTRAAEPLRDELEMGRRPTNKVPPSSASDVGSRTRARSQSRSRLLSQLLPIRGRVNGRVSYSDVKTRPRRNSSVSSRGSLRIYRKDGERANLYDSYSADESEYQTDSFEHRDLLDQAQQFDPGEHYVPQQMLYRPSETQMLDDAETFEYHRTLSSARKFLRKWRDWTHDIGENFEELNILATGFDRNTLIRQSLEAWRGALQEKIRVAETERFFNHLERRAGKARDLFLMTKAFTHWAQYASDEVERTSVARRHILRTKYFNAWRDITAVNELKVRRFKLSKFLGVWTRRTANIGHDYRNAVVFHHHRLLEHAFRQWFWSFCEQRAPEWNAGRLKQEVFANWLDITRQLKEREIWTSDISAHDRQRKALQTWKERLESIEELEPIAQGFRNVATLSLGFYKLRKQAQLAPIARQVRQRCDSRLLRTAFQDWRNHAHLSRQARKVDRTRLLRNSWTTWNDRLRIQALSLRIDDRVLVETMYKWTLASRVSLFQRVHNAQLKQSIFTVWLNKAREQHHSLEYGERKFAAIRRKHLLRIYLDKLVSTTIERKGKEHIALSMYEPKLVRVTFSKFQDRYAHMLQLNQWASDAQYYVLASSHLSRWKHATQLARRNRRREAYIQIRRAHKMNLVRSAFGKWRARAIVVANNERTAAEENERHTIKMASHIFTTWRDQTSVFLQQSNQASYVHNTKLNMKTLDFLTSLQHHIEDLNRTATIFRKESTDIEATACLKKIKWRLFQIQRGEQNALALHQRTFEKHQRSMLRFWWEQTQERLMLRDDMASPTPRARHDDDNDDDDNDRYEDDSFEHEGDETRGLENWTQFDEHGLGLEESKLDLPFSIPTKTRQESRLPRPAPVAFESTSRPYGTRYVVGKTPNEQDVDLDPPQATSTPMPLPGYLKTPSKRSVARRTLQADLRSESARQVPFGAASAPVVGFADPGPSEEAVTSFERRLREQGYPRRGRGRGRGVAFEDIIEESR